MIQYLLYGGLIMADFSSRLTEAIEIRGVTQKWLADEAETTEEIGRASCRERV